ncbi:hypothetical protein [Panacagrimonas perspica]|uniref:hypothetical protein n=1 Tax=Panacagrimonas perspica TaxID=381431 RepID=UPI001060C280|nr:hypothetical protein [Panacagrimonas perspica]
MRATAPTTGCGSPTLDVHRIHLRPLEATSVHSLIGTRRRNEERREVFAALSGDERCATHFEGTVI